MKIEEKTNKLIDEAGEKLAQVVAQSAFSTWEKKEFRKLINFEKLPQIEQDRIFNELEVTLLGLFILNLDDAINLVKGTPQETVLKMLQKSLINGFLKLFIDLGIEDKYIKQWEVLIDMRIKEYRRDYEMLLKESQSWKELQKDEGLQTAIMRIQAIALDCLSHIRRGKISEEDPLRKYLQNWITLFEKEFSRLTQALIFEPLKES